MMRLAYVLCLIGVLTFAPLSASAHQVEFVTPTQHDVLQIADPTLSQGFYGELTDAPHTYRFTISEPITIFAEILVPDIENAQNDKSGLLLQVLPNDAGVREVRRFMAKEASWELFYEWFAGDSYRRGPSYFNSLEAGTYLIEVSTPVNRGKYVLVVGKREEGKGYIATIKDIARVKEYFGKSRIAVVQSPYVYVPLTVLLAVCFIVYRTVQKRRVRT
jgi:hypothetical protein